MQINFTHPVLRVLSGLPHFRGAYLVGGAVRDLVMGRDISDIDIAVPSEPEVACREAARALGGTAFVLDSQRDVWRASLTDGAQVDVTRLKPSPPAPLPEVEGLRESFSLPTCGGGTKGGGVSEISADLAARDFTIGAMALPISGGDVIDPFGGMEDIQKRLVRALAKDAFPDDPLRLMRAFRLALQLGFTVETATLEAVRKFSGLIRDVSAERIRDELYLMLEAAGSWAAFRDMADAGLLEHVLPETEPMRGLPQGEAHDYDLLNHSLRAMEHAEDVMLYTEEFFGARAPEVSEYLSGRADGLLSMRGLIKLAALLHDCGKPGAMSRDAGRIRFTGHDLKGAEMAGEAGRRLKMSARACEALAIVTRHHMRPLHMTKDAPTRHAMYRYARDAGKDLPASLIVALADAFATREKPEAAGTDVEGLVLKLAGYYYGEFHEQEDAPLLKGRDLIAEFGLKPGPLFSELLEEVRERRAEGIISTRDEALEYVRGKVLPSPPAGEGGT